MPRHTVIPSRVLIVISTVVVALVLLLASSVQASPELTAAAASTADTLVTAEYEVRSGDTLWDIADDHTPDKGEVWNTIEEIKRLNDLGSSVIHPGQVLQVPLVSGR